MSLIEPLRIGILGAARIAPTAIVEPARDVGARLVVVAARDEVRARQFAEEHGVERITGDYAALVDDPEVDVVYNPLPNGLHAPWNLAAIRAGKHVLSEKPFAANAEQAREVAQAARAAGVHVLEAFHYPFHPVFLRLCEIVEEGAIGEIRHVEAPMRMPAPGPYDPRWRLDLAGGSTMDLGCYAFHVGRQLGRRFLGGEPHIERAVARERDGLPGVDERLTVEARYPSGATASLGSDMDAGGDMEGG
ncbi:MAG: Gfo/Idh/MocA family oxidoreductase, partial [Mobilicoccus sp.]|nr:Gfo/Idh/MocA family oxidoreductase [Mobilicoccus sp.]